MNILITGSTGLLGGRLAEYLNQYDEYDLLLGSRRTTDIRVQTCWGNSNKLAEICQDVDCIVHLAGLNAADCHRATAQQLSQDVDNTNDLINAAVTRGVKRFIYVSSAHVYGAMTGYIDELSETPNTHPYALNHLTKENLVRLAHEKGVIEGVVIRLSNAFGAPVDIAANCWMLLVNDLCRQGAAEKKLRLNTSGMQRRDFVPITRVCSILRYFITHPVSPLDDVVFNVGGQCSLTVKEMAHRVASRFGAMAGYVPVIELSRENTVSVAEPLDYSIDKLLNSGYVTVSSQTVDMEIDRLITFCLAEWT